MVNMERVLFYCSLHNSHNRLLRLEYLREVEIMRKNKYLVPMDDDIHDLILYSLINWKNALIREGRYTDAIDDALIKFLNAKRKYI